MITEILIFVVTTLVIYYWYTYKRVEYYFKEKNVKFLPGWPIFGNGFKSTLQKEHFFYDVDRVYRAFPKERYVGYIDGSKPAFLIRDPELIKLITVKDFDHFVDHKDFFSEHAEPLFASSLFSMRGEKWRTMRATLSPAFTGSKMKHMMQFMVDISRNYVQYLREHKNEDIDIEDLVRRYANDVIASTSFGLEVNSLKDKNNDFFTIGQNVLNFDLRQTIVLVLDDSFPSLIKKLGLKVYPDKTYNFFTNTIEKTVNYRKTHNVSRPDMLQLLIETPIEWTPVQLCAQAFIFFAAGFETSASLMTMTLHELAVNPDIQGKLYQEIRTFKEENGELSCDGLSSLKYLDCVVNETLRKWSPSLVLDRKCTKTYVLPPPSEGGKPIILNPGDVVFNSSNSIHLDPEYWPDQLKFDPDRWSDDNKHNIQPFTFQPFGLGPRNCIGSRFAILEAKVLLYYLMLNFKILKCSKTTDPIQLINSSFNMKALGGSWVKFEERT